MMLEFERLISPLRRQSIRLAEKSAALQEGALQILDKLKKKQLQKQAHLDSLRQKGIQTEPITAEDIASLLAASCSPASSTPRNALQLSNELYFLVYLGAVDHDRNLDLDQDRDKGNKNKEVWLSRDPNSIAVGLYYD